jgi:opacity protein-like surface antigen
MGALLLMAAIPALAADSGAADQWKFSANLYGFIAGIGGKTTGGDDIDVPFDTLLENLELTFMGGFSAHKGRIFLGVDLVYLSLSEDNDNQFTLPLSHEGLTLSTKAGLDLDSWIVTPTLGYNVIETKQGSLGVLAGARYFSMNIDLQLTAVGPRTTRHFTLSASPDVWDAIVGIKGELNLAPGWFLPYYADVGGGDSELTWQVFGGVGCRIYKNFDLIAGYRYLEYRFEPNPAVDKLNFSGPIVGAKYRF